MRPRTLALILVGAAALGLSAALAGGVRSAAPTFHGTAYLPPEPAADFALTDHRGRSVGLADYRGRPALLFFGFAHCPDVCPLTLTKLGRVLELMGEDAGEVRILLVTVDPARDTPEALARYVARFPAPIEGLTGDSAALARVRSAYGVFAGPSPMPGGHGMTHNAQVFGIDRDGQLRVLLPMEQPDEVIAADIRQLLRD